MTELATVFEEHCNHLWLVAHRLLASATEGDDAVQEAWLELARVDTSAVAGGLRETEGPRFRGIVCGAR